jgi:hypothetical protein
MNSKVGGIETEEEEQCRQEEDCVRMKDGDWVRKRED